MAWVRALGVRELPAGAARRVTLGDRTIALVNLDGALYAIDDRCPHEEDGRLSGGTFKDGSVWCPLHGARFALATGTTLEPPEGEGMTPLVARGVRTYPVAIIGDAICLQL